MTMPQGMDDIWINSPPIRRHPLHVYLYIYVQLLAPSLSLSLYIYIYSSDFRSLFGSSSDTNPVAKSW